MSTIKYIDIDSTYRNRLIYPLVGDFTLDVNSQVSGNPATAADPVLLAFPYETEQIVAFAAGPPVQYTLSANSATTIELARKKLIQGVSSIPNFLLDYAEIIDETTFEVARDATAKARAIVAGWINGVRLIDNMVMSKVGVSK